MKEAGELRIEVADHVPWARGVIHRFAEKLGLEEILLGEIDLCVTELLTNLVVHKAKDGKILFHEILEDGLRGIEIIVEDKGPGIKDVQGALAGGASTAGSLGQGLAAVQRSMDVFEIHSNTDGTRISVRKYIPPTDPDYLSAHGEPQVGVAVRTHPQSTVCGDGHVIYHNGPRILISVIDGLGHGKEARKAAAIAEAYLHANFRKPLMQMPAELHAVMRSGRGGVAAIAVIDKKNLKLDFIGVGNISGRLWLPEGKTWVRPVSMNGTLGVSFREPRLYSYPWQKGSVFIMYSDGLKETWELSTQERSMHPSQIARHLVEHNWRHTDDVTVLVTR